MDYYLKITTALFAEEVDMLNNVIKHCICRETFISGISNLKYFFVQSFTYLFPLETF